MKVSIITFGCKVNQYESEYIAEALERAGHVVVPKGVEADVYIVNSCAVTNTAERKVEHAIRNIKRRHPSAKVVLVGCYPHIGSKIDVADLVLGNSEKKKIVDYIERSGRFVEKAYWMSDGIVESVEGGYGERSRAYVKIEDGCDRRCTYCAIRIARGTKIRSKPVRDVVEEVKSLVRKGYREIVLTGINLGRYGYGEDFNLVDLLKEIEKMEGDFRIRLSSLNPEDVTPELVNAFRDFERLCPHLHLSLQSGSDRILEKMGRDYTIEDYLRIVDSLRNIDPDFSITTDIIVGFPGETESDFKMSLEIVEKVIFTKVHVFRFSPKRGTAAASMKEQVPGNVKKERSEILLDLAEKVSKMYRKGSIGKVRSVVIERKINGVALGHDEYYVLHEFKTDRREGIEKVLVKSVTEEGVASRSVDL